MSDSAGNNEPLGTTNLTMSFDASMVRGTPPVQSRITYTSRSWCDRAVGFADRVHRGLPFRIDDRDHYGE